MSRKSPQGHSFFTKPQNPQPILSAIRDSNPVTRENVEISHGEYRSIDFRHVHEASAFHEKLVALYYQQDGLLRVSEITDLKI